LIDGIIKEPIGGAHANREQAYEAVKNMILKSFNELKKLKTEDLIKKRMKKYVDMGVYES
jgi:acetyl-CoA carboxylase carboxyl transferase subunit alpha